MQNVKQALGQALGAQTISAATITETPGLELLTFDEYDVEYVVHDIESLIFWLPGAEALASVDALNRILVGNVDG